MAEDDDHPSSPANGNIAMEMRELVVSSLKDILPKEEVQRAADVLAPKLVHSIKVTATRTHIGPMPPVDVADGYERLHPGAIGRMFDLAERDQQAFIEAQRDIRKRDDDFRRLALFTGLAALGLILAAVLVLALTGHDWVAGGVAGIGASGIIATLVNAASPLRRREEAARTASSKSASAKKRENRTGADRSN